MVIINISRKKNSFLNFRRGIEIVFLFEINQKFQRLLARVANVTSVQCCKFI